MHKTSAFLMSSVALAASVGIASAQGQHPVASNKASPRYVQLPVRSNKKEVLYDQTGNDLGIGVVSQNFETSFDAYDSQGADDFTVPSGVNWRVQEVDVVGVYFNGSGPAVSEEVVFFKDRHGMPGKIVADYTLVGVDTAGSFAITLPGIGQKLKPGHYWVSVVANMDFNAGGEWAWEKQTTSEGEPAMWQNPGDGFGTGCTTWGIENDCVGVLPTGQPTSASYGDKEFALKGKTKGG